MRKLYNLFKFLVCCVIAVLSIGIMTSCDSKTNNGAQGVINLDDVYRNMPKTTYKGHHIVHYELNCSPDCPKCEARMKRIITEVIDSINNSKQY